MPISEQERRRRAAAERRRQQEAERQRLDAQRREGELEAQRLTNQRLEQERLTREAETAARSQQSSAEAERIRLAGEQEDARRRREREDFDASVPGQAYQIAKTALPPLAGLYAGHRQAAGIEARQARMAPEASARMGAGGRLAPYVGRSMLMLPEGYILREHIAPKIQSETGRELVRGVGTGMTMAGLGVVGEGAVRALTPPDRGGPRVASPASPPPLPPTQAQAPATPAAAPAGPRPHADRLIAAARAAGAKGPLNKSTAATYLESNVNAGNRAAVARELGVKSGANFASRISAAVKNLSTTRGASSLLLPMAAGALAYDATSSEAEAAGGGGGGGDGNSLLAGITAAGTAAAVPYAVSKLPEVVGRAASGVGVGMLPGTIDAMTDYSDDERAQGRNVLARYLPEWMQGGEVAKAREMATVPERNPRREMMAQQVGDRFEADLQAFLSAIDEHNSSIGQQPYGP